MQLEFKSYEFYAHKMYQPYCVWIRREVVDYKLVVEDLYYGCVMYSNSRVTPKTFEISVVEWRHD